MQRDLRVQDWCPFDLKTIIESNAWSLLDVNQKLALLCSTAEELLTQTKTQVHDLNRLKEYLGIKDLIQQIENGEI